MKAKRKRLNKRRRPCFVMVSPSGESGGITCFAQLEGPSIPRFALPHALRDAFASSTTIPYLMLTALTPSVTRLTTVRTCATWQSEGHQDCCTFGSQVTPTAPGNFIGRLTYLRGSFNPGQSKTVSVLYRRF